MLSIPIKVECYAGYKADEYPKYFYRNDKKFDITEISDRWYQGDVNPEWPVANYFKVRTACGGQHILKHEIENDSWYLVTQDEKEFPPLMGS